LNQFNVDIKGANHMSSGHENNPGMTPYRKDVEIMDLLHVGNVDIVRHKLTTGQAGNFGHIGRKFDRTTLLHACMGVGMRVGGVPHIIVGMELLIQYGQDINALDGRGMSALATAVNTDNLLVAKYLIEKGARLDCRYATAKTTGIKNAAIPFNPKISNLVTDLTLLHLCVNVRMVYYLLSRGLDVNQTDSYGRSALHIFATCRNGLDPWNSFRMAEKLVAHGVSMDMQTHDIGHTAMHMAARSKALNILALLFKNGASMSVLSYAGNTASDFATTGYTRQLFEREYERRARAEAFMMIQHARLGPLGGLHNSPIENLQEILRLAMLMPQQGCLTLPQPWVNPDL
jgi:hypothetical protein